jgi:FlaA1/EpsC-like NDP-sugar epimerase
MKTATLRERFQRINYRHLLTDFVLVVASAGLSLLLRLGYDEALAFKQDFLRILPLLIFARIASFIYFETHIIIWRYVSAVDAVKLTKAVAASSVCVIAITYLFGIGYIPRSVYFIDAFLLVFLMSGARLSRRMLHEYKSSKMIKSFGQRTLMYGAGSTGQGLVKRLLGDRDLKLFVVGFIDDDANKAGKSISGFKILGTGAELERLVVNYEIKQIVIGMPTPSPEFLKNLVAKCSEFGIRPLLFSGQSEIANASPFREVDLRDLLVRKPHTLDLDSTRNMIKSHRVLITGAGGSIGSEIARQVLNFSPSKMIVLDHSEFNLYNIDQELRHSEYTDTLVTSMVDLKDRDSLRAVFEEFRPEIILHAAAYKHVHLVEVNPFTSILNNILGMKNLLSLSEEFEVTNFVLISSDKAVNPVGIMGSTKRICEIMTSISGFRTKKNYCAVRFGNVLGSSGSLIPLLRKQISAGEALTITHPDMTRYFMLIDEAVALVLKAASIAKPGEISVLKMGEPVKIMDVARSLIQLMGKREEDVEIRFTGLRPGEKMFEELYISGKELNTEHPDILVVPKGDSLPDAFEPRQFESQVDSMIEAAKNSNRTAVVLLTTLVASKYAPSHSLISGVSQPLRRISRVEDH